MEEKDKSNINNNVTSIIKERPVGMNVDELDGAKRRNAAIRRRIAAFNLVLSVRPLDQSYIYIYSL